jgi:hypothetical protein
MGYITERAFVILLRFLCFCSAVLDSSCAQEFNSASSKLSQPLSDSHNDSPRSLPFQTFSCEFRASCLPQFPIPHESLLVPPFGVFGFLLPQCTISLFSFHGAGLWLLHSLSRSFGLLLPGWLSSLQGSWLMTPFLSGKTKINSKMGGGGRGV